MSPAGIIPRMLSLSEMISVFEAVVEPSIGLGETFDAAPQAFDRSVLLGPIVPVVPHTPGVEEVTQILGALYCWCATLNGAAALLVANSQVPAVFWATVCCPAAEL